MQLLDSLGISDGLAENVRLSITVKKHLRISSPQHQKTNI
jgi:hypothetical protein